MAAARPAAASTSLLAGIQPFGDAAVAGAGPTVVCGLRVRAVLALGGRTGRIGVTGRGCGRRLGRRCSLGRGRSSGRGGRCGRGRCRSRRSSRGRCSLGLRGFLYAAMAAARTLTRRRAGRAIRTRGRCAARSRGCRGRCRRGRSFCRGGGFGCRGGTRRLLHTAVSAAGSLTRRRGGRAILASRICRAGKRQCEYQHWRRHQAGKSLEFHDPSLPGLVRGQADCNPIYGQCDRQCGCGPIGDTLITSITKRVCWPSATPARTLPSTLMCEPSPMLRGNSLTPMSCASLSARQ
jgi:hypothetical protein